MLRRRPRDVPGQLGARFGLATLSVADTVIADFYHNGRFTGDGTLLVPLHVNNDLPFQLSMLFDATVSANLGAVSNLGFFSYSTRSTADFFHTVGVGGVSAVDSDGNPIPGLTFLSSNGSSYLGDSVATPEPESAALLLLGAALFGLRRARVRYSRSKEK